MNKSTITKIIFSLLCVLLVTSCLSMKARVNNKLVTEFTQNEVNAKVTDRGVTIYLPNLFFKFDSAILSDAAVNKMKYIATVCNQKFAANLDISVEGHTDSEGPDDYNMKLSKKRASAVSSQLGISGVSDERLNTAWFGETRPLVPNEFADGKKNFEARRTNRRVEIVILNP